MATDPTNTNPPATNPAPIGTPLTVQPPAGTPPAAGAEDLAKELRELKAWRAEQEAAAKLEADAKKTDAQKRADREAEREARIATVERRAFELDLRDAGIPRELCSQILMPADEAGRPAAIEKAKLALAATVAAALSGRQPNGQGSAPINPAPPPGAPTPDPSQKATSAWDAITKNVIQMGRAKPAR